MWRCDVQYHENSNISLLGFSRFSNKRVNIQSNNYLFWYYGCVSALKSCNLEGFYFFIFFILQTKGGKKSNFPT